MEKSDILELDIIQERKNAASNRSGRKASYLSKGDAKRLKNVQY